MRSGKPLGFWSKDKRAPFAHLVPEARYRVVQPFSDFDRTLHPVGEEWTYLGTSYHAYDDGRSLFVSVDGHTESHIRMQNTAGEQASVLASFGEYVVEISPALK